jgi:hypothetical protein
VRWPIRKGKPMVNKTSAPPAPAEWMQNCAEDCALAIEEIFHTQASPSIVFAGIIQRHAPAPAGEWIAVAERLPKFGQVCVVRARGRAQWMALAWVGEKFVWADSHFHGESAFDPFPSEMATHWQPFPSDKLPSAAAAPQEGK